MRLICEARGRHRAQFLDKILKNSAGSITAPVTLGMADADYSTLSARFMEKKSGRRRNWFENPNFKGAHLEVLASRDFSAAMETAVDQLYRTSADYRFEHHDLCNLQDYLDYFNMCCDVVSDILVENEITHSLTFHIPHLFIDTVVYEVSKAMGLETLVLTQTFSHHHFFSLNNMEAYGRVADDPAFNQPIALEKGAEPEIWYMNDAWQQKSPRGKLKPKAVFLLLKHIAQTQPQKLLDVKFLKHMIREISSVYEAFPQWRDPFAKFFHANSLAYLKTLADYEDGTPDLSKKFVYFPLHNQPEMSTSALGGGYRDQVLAIEQLSSILPDDWHIFVKENPRQGAFARGPLFFHRLNRLPNVEIMPADMSTHALIDSCQLVSSITSTAGWEAALKGKNAIMFGNPWFGSLPGIHRFSRDIDVTKLAAQTFPHAELERRYGLLFSKAHDGMIEKDFLKIHSKYLDETNANLVADSAIKLLRKELPVSFS